MNNTEIKEAIEALKLDLAQAIAEGDGEEEVVCEEAIAQLENDLKGENHA